MAAHVEGEHVEPGGVEHLRVWERPVARRFPAVDEDDAGSAARPGGHEPGGEDEAVRRRDLEPLVGEPERIRRPDGRMPARVPGAHPVDEREPVGERDRQGSERSGKARAAGGGDGNDLHIGPRPGPVVKARGRRCTFCRAGQRAVEVHRCLIGVRGHPAGSGRRRGLHSSRAPQGSPRRSRRRDRRSPRRDQGRLARARPPSPPGPDGRRPRDRAAGDPPHGRDQRGVRGADEGRRDPGGAGWTTRAGRRSRRRAIRRSGPGHAWQRAGGPPPPPRTRPVTGRLDLSGTVRPRNQTTTPPGVRIPLTGQPPLRSERRARSSAPRSRRARWSGAGWPGTFRSSRPRSTTPWSAR